MLEILAGLSAEKMPRKPEPWVSPKGPMVLHGDLFGDGRHLAVEGSGLAVGDKKGWKVLSEWKDVFPAWVPEGKTPEEAGYQHIYPPSVPFVLKDVTGDKVPEILISFENDGWSLGYHILKKKGEGAELLEMRSERGEPRLEAGLMVVCTSDWGRKCWGSVDTFYRWTKGVPVELGSFGEYCADPDHPTLFVMRRLPDGSEQALGIESEGDKLVVKTGKFKAWEIEDAKDFATVRDAADKEGPGLYKATALLFERVTGIPGELCFEASREGGAPEADLRKRHREAKAAMKLEIEGSPEAKALLGEKKPESAKPQGKKKR
ncbi:hypothetical protein [Haloferula sp. BvORR071]|uniref:hypothetical protein n=1 Tax=Haloferula sp. BvORR071 TaxID=1396141 RepID=UPI00224104EF|nr:hypothetical protein [Haloferula sp. BvORR071]